MAKASEVGRGLTMRVNRNSKEGASLHKKGSFIREFVATRVVNLEVQGENV